MVLYTPMAYHDIFQEEGAPHKLVSHKGKMVYARQDEAGQYRLVQLVSTDPADYLTKEFSPGAILPNEME